MSSKPLRIFMCDLTHDTVVLVSDTIPINIGYIGSYAKKKHGDAIELELFKYPQSVIEAIKANPPDVIALSNYSWNSYLSERVAEIAHKYNPACITVQGGTNFPHRGPLQRDFLLRRMNTDVYVELEAEISFSDLVGRILELRERDKVLDGTVLPGLVYLIPGTKHSAEPVCVSGPSLPRIVDLDEIPSPYLNGMLDKFFDGRLTPFLETNRGCPFLCTFCHTGNDYFNKVNKYSLDRIKGEIDYIGPRMHKLGITNLHIADTNFAMYPRDREICQEFLKTQQEFGWPRHIMSTTGKNNKALVIDITRMLGTTFSVNMSVQSMDTDVLKNIKRSNIRLEDYVAVSHELNDQGRATKGEVIIGLPGESKKTFVEGIKKMLESGVSSICSNTLLLLYGTEFQEPEFRAKYEYMGRYRIVPLNFGEYDGVRVFDYEEAGIQSKDMPFDDYLWIRGLCLMVEILHNSRPFHEFFRYAEASGITTFDMITRLYSSMDRAPESVRKVLADYLGETDSELWESQDALIEHYRQDENYDKLLKGEAGGNLIYKYKAVSLAHCVDGWTKFLSQICLEIYQERFTDPEARRAASVELSALGEFIRKRLDGLLRPEADLSPISMESPYDILAWRKAPKGTPLSVFTAAKPIVYEFGYTQEQLVARNDQFKRYGTHTNALSKIVTRVSNVESLFRKVRVQGAEQAADVPEQDMFVRYGLSN